MNESSQEPGWLVPGLRGTPRFTGTRSAFDENSGGLRLLHLNESPYPPSPRVADAVAGLVGSLNRYPNPYGAALADALAERTGIAPERIVFGCGSEELIFALAAIALLPGDAVAVPAPSFPAFAIAARMRGATAFRCRLGADGANDPDTLLAAVGARTRIVFCCTPNPPSGGMMQAAALERLVERLPPEVILVVDEAYSEFARHLGGPDILEIVERRKGYWVVLRTFSKAYGLAGARIGYALCGSDAIVDALRKAKLQYGASLLSQAAALAALGDDGHLNRTVTAIAEERDRLSTGLIALGLEPWPSAANFVSVKLPLPASAAMNMMRAKGILVRDWRDPDHLQEIRITLGRTDDTEAVLAAVADLVASINGVQAR